MYFTKGMYLTPELDFAFRNLISTANGNNVTFYSVDVRGVILAEFRRNGADFNAGARAQQHHHNGEHGR